MAKASAAPETGTEDVAEVPTIEALAAEVARLAAIVDHNVARCLIVPAPSAATPAA